LEIRLRVHVTILGGLLFVVDASTGVLAFCLWGVYEALAVEHIST